MNVFEGMARIARVTAIAYWVVGAFGVWSSWRDATPYGSVTLDQARRSAAFSTLGTYLVVYAVLWVVFRALRWIGRGFLNEP